MLIFALESSGKLAIASYGSAGPFPPAPAPGLGFGLGDRQSAGAGLAAAGGQQRALPGAAGRAQRRSLGSGQKSVGTDFSARGEPVLPPES